MAGAVGLKTKARTAVLHASVSEPPAVRMVLIALALVFLAGFLMLPILIVIVNALNKGMVFYFQALAEPAAMAAIRLTLLVAVITVPFNLFFGLAASWAIAKFDFLGKKFLITLVDLPFTVSPVISGLIYVLVFGAQGLL